MEDTPLENIQREAQGVSPSSKKVLYQEKDEHVDSEAHPTVSPQGGAQDRVNIPKTSSTATLGEKSSKGPWCQETKGAASASARQKAAAKHSSDPPRKVNTSNGDEDRYTYDELIFALGDISKESKDIQHIWDQMEGVNPAAFTKGEKQGAAKKAKGERVKIKKAKGECSQSKGEEREQMQKTEVEQVVQAARSDPVHG